MSTFFECCKIWLWRNRWLVFRLSFSLRLPVYQLKLYTELKFDLHLILYLQTETILEGTTAVSSNNLMQDIGRPCWAFHQCLMRHPALAPCSVAPRRNIKLKSSEARWEPPVYEDLTFSHSLRWPLLGILNHSKHFLLSQKNNIGVPLLLYKQNSKVAFL